MTSTSPILVATCSTSPIQSPRSSVSSLNNRSGPPLTPVYELDKMTSDLVISADEVNESHADDVEPIKARNIDVKSARRNLPGLTVPPPTFNPFSFGTSSPSASSSSSIGRTPSPLSSTDDVALPSEEFKFGSCPSTSFLGTPTAEQGPFEYPSSSSTSPPRRGSISPTASRRESLALGMTHRRGSIIPSHPHLGISPPATRRSSTWSTITTLPAAGRRPSIIHSATVEVNLPQAEPTSPPPHQLPLSATASRRQSVLMFPAKPLPAPIPPSLLARRGSLPAAQLFGVPLSDQPNRMRASYSSGSASGSATISTAQLYLRRQSVVSESGFSNSSGATVMDAGEGGVSRRPSMRPRTPSADFTFPSSRRGSVSFFPPIPTTTNQSQTPTRSGSLSSRSSVASTSSHRSSGSSRQPIHFSPRHPSFSATYAYPSRQSSITSVTSSIPASPKIELLSKRTRGPTNGSTFSTTSLSSSEEEDHEEDLPSPNQHALEGQLPSAMTFVDPWSVTSSKPIATSPVQATSGEVAKSHVPLETPPLDTVYERPPLESMDSGATERA
ncbi:uncharacterized protein IL334_000713 [Kwoniella shivajii]|uniref:Uncharacterized protein n=1 Tax=Kwoniella shivajii TaxID=564305 RepID=A0ABZ1CPW8_9TREE|nr:hypothetical protein IL334_000713 [Kwoniella shivajii]